MRFTPTVKSPPPTNPMKKRSHLERTTHNGENYLIVVYLAGNRMVS